MTRQVSRAKFGSILSSGCGAGADGNAAAGQPGDDGQAHHDEADRVAAGLADDEGAAEHGAEQHRYEGAHLDKAVAAEQFVLLEMLRQDRIFDRAEKGRLHAGQEDAEELQPDLIGEEREGGERHHEDLGEFDPPDEQGLIVFVGELAGGRREEEEGQDQEARRQGVEQGRVDAGAGAEIVDQAASTMRNGRHCR